MTRTEEIKQMVAKRQDRLNALNDEIWNYAELYFREEKSSAALIRMLKEEGFEVEEQVDGMDTAFIGTWGSGRPVIGILGEFDALPSLVRKPPARCTRKSLPAATATAAATALWAPLLWELPRRRRNTWKSTRSREP